ncbi:MAG: hypothetical protein AAGJ97_03790 [Planctomycetota bacterium]
MWAHETVAPVTSFLGWLWAALMLGYETAGAWMIFYRDFAVGWWMTISPIEYVMVITLIAAMGWVLMGARDKRRL